MSTPASNIVVFSYADWSAAYPELAAYVTQPQAQGYFNRAQLMCDNTATSIVIDASQGGQRETLLNMLVAHIAALNAPLNGQASSPLVGRISNATQGSVSVQTQMDFPPGSAQWFNQTKYGAEYWQATAQYRSMQYAPGATSQFNPWGSGSWGRRGGSRGF
ncbi:DUF4054 domain-containing protein [Paraburkholderia elongata]|uniref:DUF4054 domain-containing protein n=1 Tax=Paraburkholderia elongata TaxID=2675747 RepID=A0A972SKI1_9BURK|nr:DUF4054 domain-containing protein [Paraburkholderia elongata]NPT59098.1 DUF4054 domain-containing protein [Paraburkholderia elongata]